MAPTPTPTKSKIDPAVFSRLPSLTDTADAGGFGPMSFHGWPIAAAYTPHRYGKEFKPDQDASYFVALWVRFHVTEVLDSDSGWDPDEHDNQFDYWWKVGGKSLQFFFATNDGKNPAGIDIDDDKPVPLGFEALDLMAAGRLPSGHVVTFGGDPESMRGRWMFPREGIPDSKSKLQPKSGYYLFMQDSIKVIEPVDPSLVVTTEGKKKGELAKALNMYAPGLDGDPLGALFFLGLSGVWDTAKVQLEFKDKSTGEQKYLRLTTYDGREEVEVGGLTPPAPTTAKKSAPAATTTKKAAPVTDTAANADSGTDESPDEQLTRLILAALPPKGSIARAVLAKAVVGDSGEFPATRAKAALDAYNIIIKGSSTKEGAKELAEMGMPPEFTYDPATEKVERFTT